MFAKDQRGSGNTGLMSHRMTCRPRRARNGNHLFIVTNRNEHCIMLELSPVERSDFSEIARIDDVAMKDNGIKQVIDIAVAKEGIPRTIFFNNYLANGFDESKPWTFWKVVDSETGEIISVAKYSFQHEAEVAPQQDPPQANQKHVDGENRPPSAELIQLITETLSKDWSEFVTEHAAGKPHASMMLSFPFRKN